MTNRQIYKHTDFLQAVKKGLFTGHKKDLLESIKKKTFYSPFILKNIKGLSLHRIGTKIHFFTHDKNKVKYIFKQFFFTQNL
jgi:hypothetical protein